ncbi:endonuclease NucS domain-containing protein [Enterococcus sp. AZ126]|uniref:endonuclease NucS domain-containing protein n=1 Tax=Enterococcus sp. AZ126 TaxID=2774635 RepID=UPI003F203793
MESKIRDYLAENLNFLSDELSLIGKEYLLPNNDGTKGYVDLLAKDKQGNYVIIEIKRSNQAARQALHEIFKYSALLKRNLYIKQSEIRVILISTTWDELLVPFSQFVLETDLLVEGYEIEVNNHFIPIAKRKIKSVPNPIQRKISRIQHIFLYGAKRCIYDELSIISYLLEQVGIKEYILLNLNYQGTNNQVIHPKGIYLAFQKVPISNYIEFCKKQSKHDLIDYGNLYEELLEIEKNYDGEELQGEIEQAILGEVINRSYCDTSEIGYPEKLLNMLHSDWKMENHVCGGAFAKDQLYTVNKLIQDIIGLNDTNYVFFYDYANSKHLAKLKEVLYNAKNVFYGNKIWKQHFTCIFNELEEKYDNYTIVVSITNPESILECLVYGIEPTYEIIINHKDYEVVQIYRGNIEYNFKETSLKDILIKHFYNNPMMLFSVLNSGELYKQEMDIMNDIGLKYISKRYDIFNDKTECYDVRISEYGEIFYTPCEEKTLFQDYLKNTHVLVADLKELFSSNIAYDN